MLVLIDNIGTELPESKRLVTNLAAYWDHKDQLHIVGNVIIMNERVIIPPKPRAL